MVEHCRRSIKVDDNVRLCRAIVWSKQTGWVRYSEGEGFLSTATNLEMG